MQIEETLSNLLSDMPAKIDNLAEPFGIRECALLPELLRNYTVSIFGDSVAW